MSTLSDCSDGAAAAVQQTLLRAVTPEEHERAVGALDHVLIVLHELFGGFLAARDLDEGILTCLPFLGPAES